MMNEENRTCTSQTSYFGPTMPPTAGSHPMMGWSSVIPQTLPWSMPPQSHPSVIRFTGGDFNFHPSKRKPDTEVDLPPSKQLITEEKMAAHMSNLHISDTETMQTTPSSSSSRDSDDLIYRISKSSDSQELPKLVVCEEVRKLKTEPILPQAILNRYERPQMALVLWQPPTGVLGKRLKEITKEKRREERRDEETDESMENEMSDNNNGVQDYPCSELEMQNSNRFGEFNVPESIFRPIDPAPSPQLFNPTSFHNQMVFPTPHPSHFQNNYFPYV